MIDTILNTSISMFRDIYQVFQNKIQRDKLRQSLRDRLHREIKINLEVINILLADGHQLISYSLKTKVIDEMMELPYPLSEILNNDLNKNVTKRFSENKNNNHNYWTSNINNEVELLERIKIRIEILRVRNKYGLRVGDLQYLKLLLSGMDETLRLSSTHNQGNDTLIRRGMDGKKILYLVQNHSRDMAVTIKEDCDSRYNNAWICRRHGSLDFKREGVRSNTIYIKGELVTHGVHIEHHENWAPSNNGTTCCMAGTNYEGHTRFGSIEEAVRFLKQYFDLRACEENEDQTQEWIDALDN